MLDSIGFRKWKVTAWDIYLPARLPAWAEQKRNFSMSLFVYLLQLFSYIYAAYIYSTYI